MTTATYPLTLPADAGINGQWLTTNGSNNVFWSSSNSSRLIQRVFTLYTSSSTGTTTTPYDDTIPQNTEGDQYMTQAITPTSSSNTLKVFALWNGSASIANYKLTLALFQDSTANALASVSNGSPAAGKIVEIYMNYALTAGTTSSTTFKIRVGDSSASTLTFNGQAGAGLFGGVMTSCIVVSEYAT